MSPPLWAWVLLSWGSPWWSLVVSTPESFWAPVELVQVGTTGLIAFHFPQEKRCEVPWASGFWRIDIVLSHQVQTILHLENRLNLEEVEGKVLFNVSICFSQPKSFFIWLYINLSPLCHQQYLVCKLSVLITSHHLSHSIFFLFPLEEEEWASSWVSFCLFAKVKSVLFQTQLS